MTTNIAKADPKDSRLSNGVLTLQKNVSSKPIFWVHYLNVNLDKALGQKRPVTFLILTPEDIEALGENPTLNSIAARFVEKILLTQPEGPYTLGGFCIGAVLAYEIAVQMRKAGHVVAHLMMLDAPGPSYLKMQGPLAPRLSNPLFIMKRIMKLGLRASWIRIRDRAIERLSKLGIGRAKIELQRGQTLIEIAASTYQGEVYGGKVLLLLAADNAPHINFLPEWQAIIPNDLNFEYIQAHHSELMVQPAVQRIADAIAAHLESAPAALSESFGSDINVALSSTTDQNGIPVPEPGTPGNLYPVMPAKQTFVRHESSQGK